MAAHPRACGENAETADDHLTMTGSSPRVRGKQQRRPLSPRDSGLIPARAGKTGGSVCRSASPAAHPRACGENSASAVGRPLVRGSSPRVRGKQGGQGRAPFLRRLIPARAGKTGAGLVEGLYYRAHPRACGENRAGQALDLECDGSSPRVRGKRSRGVAYDDPGGLIPARAGKTGPCPAASTNARAHPRACGENCRGGSRTGSCAGSSPRVRGKPDHVPQRVRTRGLIPARAGKTRR